jgi:S1-C subfamily serine protease
MKSFLFSLFIFAISHFDIDAQPQRIIYFDKDWKETYKSNAEFYRVINLGESGVPSGIVSDFFITGELQWQGKFLSKNYSCPDAESCRFDGVCTWYHKNGRKSMEGLYSDGKLVGDETQWDTNGRVTKVTKLWETVTSEVILKGALENTIKKGEYDPLQGIWNVTSDYQMFIDRKPISNKVSRSKKCIIMLDGKYNVFTVDQGTTGMKFIPTQEAGKYRVVVTEGATTHTGSGQLSDYNTLKVVVEINKETLRKALKTYDVEGIEAFNEMQFHKLYPTKHDIEEIERRALEEAPRSGTGFALANNGTIVTNYHVVQNAKSIKVKGINGDFARSLNASIVQVDISNDLAIIKIDDYDFKTLGTIPYKIKTATSDVGEDVFVLGYPLTATMGDEIKLTTGVLSSKSGYQGNATQYQISAPIQPGNSGGPLFDKSGYVIGIINAKHSNADNVGYAIKSLYLQSLIESTNEKISTTNPANVASKTLSEKVKLLKHFIYIIEVNND